MIRENERLRSFIQRTKLRKQKQRVREEEVKRGKQEREKEISVNKKIINIIKLNLSIKSYIHIIIIKLQICIFPLNKSVKHQVNIH